MTSIAFHFNAPAKLAYACRLLRKAAASGSTVAVLGDQALLAKLDQQLWSFSALDFVPHARAASLTEQQRQRTPIWLCEAAEQGLGRQVLVNLTAQMPSAVAPFERVIEVVSQEQADRQSARQRWKQYTEQGYQIVRHDLNVAA
jgi:DNA polymerase III subunit chi